MVSWRRLAREWALKVLYQVDVGRTTLTEALDASLDRLRSEFVQLGSRTTTGSPYEAMILNLVTLRMAPFLIESSPAWELSAAGAVERVLLDAPYWIEVALEKTIKTAAPGLSLSPPRLLQPQDLSEILPDGGNDHLAQSLARLSTEERTRLDSLVWDLRTEIPAMLQALHRREARAFAKRIYAARPAGSAVVPYLLAEREAFNEANRERWVRTGQVVSKQLYNFSRVGAFTDRLVRGTAAHRGQVDSSISALSSGWKLDRQVAVDRNILRMAAYELLFVSTIPTSASINEAVELAKRYSTAESGRFVNGVLGALAGEVGPKLLGTGTAEVAEDPLESEAADEIDEIDELEEIDDESDSEPLVEDAQLDEEEPGTL